MLIIDPATDPGFNLAAEEFLLRETDDPILRIWRNDPTVVVGRHQIPCLEANVVEAWRRKIPILRRLSGGGAVYHDLGNVNFTIILPAAKGRGIDFALMLAPVSAALNDMGVAATYAGRGDLRLFGRKISGNSAYLCKDRVLHHGTLLFDSDLDTLEALLEVRGDSVAGRSVRSVRSTVANIRDVVHDAADTWDFATEFLKRLATVHGFDADSARTFSSVEKSRILEIASATYSTPEWNLGASPDYTLERRAMKLAVKNGRVAKTEFSGDEKIARELGAALEGVWHEPEAIEAALLRAKLETCTPVEMFF